MWASYESWKIVKKNFVDTIRLAKKLGWEMDTDDWRMEDITELRNQRDKLLAELKLLVENLDEYWYEVDIKRIRELIAEVEKKLG